MKVLKNTSKSVRIGFLEVKSRIYGFPQKPKKPKVSLLTSADLRIGDFLSIFLFFRVYKILKICTLLIFHSYSFIRWTIFLNFEQKLNFFDTFWKFLVVLDKNSTIFLRIFLYRPFSHYENFSSKSEIWF